MTMEVEREGQETPDGPATEPVKAPPAEQLEEENPTESPAQSEEETQTDQDAARERASISMDSPSQLTKSTQGLTVGGTQKSPSD
jgi:hypothetical protein